MDTSIQIQSIKTQIENMNLQINNIELQNNNMLMMNNYSIKEQILNLSIQMFNTGIQAFNTGKNINVMMNMQNSYDKLKKISEQISSIISEYDDMNMLLMQQQMMMQQMQQQIEAQQQLMKPQIKEKYNMIFKTTKGKVNNLIVDFDITVGELINRYINNYYGPVKGGLIFLFNGKRIKMNEQRTVKDFFGMVKNPNIIVNNY